MTHCTYPDCNCPFDAPADPNWCARGLPKSLEKIAERHLRQDLYLFGLKGLLADPAILDHIPAVKALREENERLKNTAKTCGAIIHRMTVANQAAWIEWRHGGGAESAMEWVENGLVGPGLIPEDDEPHNTNAQAYFDANISGPGGL